MDLVNKCLDNKTALILGVVIGVATYAYLSYSEKQRQEKNPKSKPKDVSYIIPIVVAVVAWIISYNVLSNKTSPPQLGKTAFIKAEVAAQSIDSPGKINNMTSVVIDSLQETIAMPNTEVFTDLGKFTKYTY
jgi:multisubunit Na+/H+ antiporter MnhB subunit